jgi:hypothetical protein
LSNGTEGRGALLLLRPDRVLGDDRLCSSAESTAPAVGVRALLLDDLDGVIIDTVLVSAFGSTTCATVELAVVVGTEPPVADADVLTVAVDETAVLGVDAAVAVVFAEEAHAVLQRLLRCRNLVQTLRLHTDY